MHKLKGKINIIFWVLRHKFLNNNICNNEFRMWFYITKKITSIKYKHLNEKKQIENKRKSWFWIISNLIWIFFLMVKASWTNSRCFCVCVCVFWLLGWLWWKFQVEITKIGGLLMFFQIFIKHVPKFDCHLLVY